MNDIRRALIGTYLVVLASALLCWLVLPEPGPTLFLLGVSVGIGVADAVIRSKVPRV